RTGGPAPPRAPVGAGGGAVDSAVLPAGESEVRAGGPVAGVGAAAPRTGARARRSAPRGGDAGHGRAAAPVSGWRPIPCRSRPTPRSDRAVARRARRSARVGHPVASAAGY